jgi:hypothetical protein
MDGGEKTVCTLNEVIAPSSTHAGPLAALFNPADLISPSPNYSWRQCPGPQGTIASGVQKISSWARFASHWARAIGQNASSIEISSLSKEARVIFPRHDDYGFATILEGFLFFNLASRCSHMAEPCVGWPLGNPPLERLHSVTLSSGRMLLAPG